MSNEKNNIQTLIWELGKRDELLFWFKWFENKGLEWPNDYKNRLDPSYPLQNYVTEVLETSLDGGLNILDVGAGPLTILGKKWGDVFVNITAVDALAKQYLNIINLFNITPLVTTLECEVEGLTNMFEENSFDLVHMSNALDHSYDPLRGISQMISVVKKRDYVILKHNVNEAERENYSGLHQWNFQGIDNDFVIWNKSTTMNVSNYFKNTADIRYKTDGQFITVYIKKN